jgi:hypothetical protein
LAKTRRVAYTRNTTDRFGQVSSKTLAPLFQ